MSTAEALAQIRSLRVQLDVLEARIRNSELTPAPGSRTFADLYGLLRDQGDSTPEEINASRYPDPELPEP